MKKTFSNKWISSTQKRKQRKYRINAPLHIKHKFLSANLSKSLRQKHGKRSLPIRKGDEVLIMRGSFAKKKAKVVEVDTKKLRVSLEGIQRSKKDGTKVNVHFHPSALQIISLNTEDKLRIAKTENKEKKNASNKG